MPERAAAERAEAAALAALGAGPYETERATGVALTVDEVLSDLGEAVCDHLAVRPWST